MLDDVLQMTCWDAARRDMLEWPVVNGVSTISKLAKPGDARSDAQTLASETVCTKHD